MEILQALSLFLSNDTRFKTLLRLNSTDNEDRYWPSQDNREIMSSINIIHIIHLSGYFIGSPIVKMIQVGDYLAIKNVLDMSIKRVSIHDEEFLESILNVIIDAVAQLDQHAQSLDIMG